MTQARAVALGGTEARRKGRAATEVALVTAEQMGDCAERRGHPKRSPETWVMCAWPCPQGRAHSSETCKAGLTSLWAATPSEPVPVPASFPQRGLRKGQLPGLTCRSDLSQAAPLLEAQWLFLPREGLSYVTRLQLLGASWAGDTQGTAGDKRDGVRTSASPTLALVFLAARVRSCGTGVTGRVGQAECKPDTWDPA